MPAAPDEAPPLTPTSDREGTLGAIVAATLSRAFTGREGLRIEVAPETVDPAMWSDALALASTLVDAIVAGGECQPDVRAAVLPAELLERAAIAAEALHSNATAALFDRNVARADEMADAELDQLANHVLGRLLGAGELAALRGDVHVLERGGVQLARTNAGATLP